MIFGDTGRYILQLTERFSCRIATCDSLLSRCLDNGYGAVLVVAEPERAAFETLVATAGFRTSDVLFVTANPDDQTSISQTLRDAVTNQSRGTPGRRGSLRPVCSFLDLSPFMATVTSAAAAVELVESLRRVQEQTGAMMVASVSAAAIPRGADTAFCSVHDHWVFDGCSVPDLLSGERAATALSVLALATPQARLALLHNVRDGSSVAFPGLEHSYRRGFLLLDLDLDIRYASGQVTVLLDRSPSDLVDHALASCLDGVDLATVRRETVRVERGGESSPFIVSWRLAPGRYEPREVTVDLVTRENRVVGYLLSVGISETVRGPRTVYRDAREELALADFVGDEEGDTVEQAINALESTQITRREHEVLLLILQGKANKEIARHLSIAEVTVKKHLTSVYRKLRINNRRELLQSFSVPVTKEQAKR
jgi:DNA-binding CsgD family transcriptional regulator